MKLCRDAAFLKNDGLYSQRGIKSAPTILTDGLRDLIIGSISRKLIYYKFLAWFLSVSNPHPN